MALDPSTLPLLLAGPIVRRVEPDLVSVWIATSRPCSVALLLYDGADVLAEDDPGDTGAGWVSARQPTLPAGAHLHVLTAALDLRQPDGNAARAASATLAANRVYSYDLRLFEEPGPALPHSLRSLGLLGAPVPLGFDPGELPSFRTCPLTVEQLVLVHGSCRQLFAVPPVEDDPTQDDDPFEPPGGWPGAEPVPDAPAYDATRPDPFPDTEYPQLPKRDGLLWVDTLNEALGPVRVAERPHQLFLTGDQVYADQAPAALMPVLNHLARVLVGDEDLGASPDGTQFRSATLLHFPPAFRADIVHRSAGLTTSSGGSHLLSFGEFVAYYLLTWSPALWHELAIGADDADRAGRSLRTLWPDDFDPEALAMPEDWRLRFLYRDGEEGGAFSDAYLALLEQLPVADSPPREAPPDTHADWFFVQRRRWATDKYWSPAHVEWWTRRFRGGLGRVRRALANVPSCMVADDHDISDDWNFSRQWREAVYTRPLGVDILRNGLLAIALMQAWGNDPRRWAAGPERELLGSIDPYRRAMADAAAQGASLPRGRLDRLHALLGLPQLAVGDAPPSFRPLVEFSFQVESPCHRVLGVDGRTRRRFATRTAKAGGIDFEGPPRPQDPLPTGLPGEVAPGVFADSPMAAALPPPSDGDARLVVVLTAVPVIGPEGMEQVLVPFQRHARLMGDVDAEAWSYDPPTYEALLAALARYGSVLLLSGDVHIGWSAALDHWRAPAGEPVRTARIVQLVSSGLTKDWGDLAPPLRNHALTLDVFEAATTPALLHAERIGWGTPLRTMLQPPPAPRPAVLHAEGAHPFYRARLGMAAPVVPTHGWPAGCAEAREPDWAWRATMARDEREDSTDPPTLDRRWTPVALPTDPTDPAQAGWHAHAARRMAYGRVFAVNPNIGIVTFQRDGDVLSVQHVLAGELPPLADTGVVPTGLQPFIVHRLSLAPLAPQTWATARPRLVDDGGWGVDTTEPLFALLLHMLPTVWQAAAGFTGAVWTDLPPVIDDVAREGLLADAADRMAGPFRRRVLRELGPFTSLSDAELDALPAAALAALAPAVGRLDADREARALLRPDLERLLALNQSLDHPAALFDDLLLLACADAVNQRARALTVIAGLLVTFRSPVTRHVPVLRQLLGGLWDLWRHHTGAGSYDAGGLKASLLGLLTAVPRAGVLLLELFDELVVNLIQDLDPRPEGGPPVVTPALVLAGVGVWLGLALPRRFTTISGWEGRTAPPALGTRNTGPGAAKDAEVLARQTLSLLVHPGGTARYARPARVVSATLLPPPDLDDVPPSDDEPNLSAEGPVPGSLLVAWDGGLEAEQDLGKGVRVRLELDGRGHHRLPWRGVPVPAGRLGSGALRITLLRPLRATLAGLQLRITPAVSLEIGIRGDADEDTLAPALTLRLALNDREDRITFVPDDAFLVQLLPTEGVALPMDAALSWTLGRGWQAGGMAEPLAAHLAAPAAPPADGPSPDPDGTQEEPPRRSPLGPQTEVVNPLNTRLGMLALRERRLEVATAANDDGIALTVSVTGTVTADFGPVRLSLSGLGLRGDLRLHDTINDDDELTDFSLAARMPTGLAVAIDTAAVAGGGFIERLARADGGTTWRGALALRLGARVDASAFAVVEAGGARHWSLLAMLALRFAPPVQLTQGLQLVAVGALLALHRTMDVNALRDAAASPEGRLDAVLLPDRPQDRFLEMLPMLDRLFPTAPGHQVVALLAHIDWRADSGTRFGEFRLALLAELDQLQFGLYGVMRLGFPSLENPHVLRLRAGVEVLLDLAGGYARFSITLIEASVFKHIQLTGGCALLVRWGGRDEFAFTIGGFHPAFRPYIPPQLREPPRLAASWKPHRLVELDLHLYYAVTSTSFQYGFGGHLRAGASWGGIRADAEFNFLVMTAPDMHLEVDLAIRVTAFLFGADLISAGFRGAISGPGPWTFVGAIYWEVCGVDLSKDLGPYTWGDSPLRLGTIEQAARDVLGDGLADPAHWTMRRSAMLPVRLRPGSEQALDARDRIDVRQTRLPLGVPVEVHDANKLVDPGVWTLRPGPGPLRKIEDLTDVYPTRRYLLRPPKETPFRGGLASGARLAGDGWTLDATAAVASDEDLREDLVLDTLPQPPRRVPGRPWVVLDVALRAGVAAQATGRRWTRHAHRLEARR